jgi:hypothetical protein
MRKSLSLILLLALVGFGAAPAAVAGKEKKPEPAAEAAEDEPDKADKKKKDEKPFADAIEDFEKIEGLFTFYRNADEGKVLMEIRPDQLDRLYLLALTRKSGDGTFFDSGAMLWDFPFELKRVGRKVEMIDKNVYFRAAKDAAIHRAVRRDVSDSLVASAKLEADPEPESGALLIDPASFFVQDVAGVANVLREFLKANYNMDKENSHFGTIRSFPENTEIDVVLRFQGQSPIAMPTVPDPRSFQHVYHYSLATLPETDYEPRVADDRVGHFLTMYQDYTSLTEETPYVRYVTRWDLRKAEPKFGASKPRQPILFWLENTIPVEYRDAVREGVLVWNDAFEKIGFKDAIVVQQQPDDADWSADDVRYNAVRWIVQPGGGYAVGPSRANPFNGQIYDADIRVSADMIRYVFLEYQQLAGPLARLADPNLVLDDPFALAGLPAGGALEGPGLSPGAPSGGFRGFCDHARGAVQQAAFGWSVVAARAAGGGDPVDAEQYLHDFIVSVIAHEVGHTLGLRHNFKASTIHENGSLQTAEAAATGLTGSMMDYTPVNLAPRGQEQGAYWQTELGPYDYWAIEYAYKPYDPQGGQSEKAMLDEIASRVADPMLQYGTDEDAWSGPQGIDPTANRWDLGRDPIAFHTGQVGLAEELWSRMQAEFEKPGHRYQRMRQVFGQGMGQYSVAVFNVAKYVGGVYNHRDHVGDPGGRLPFVPVPADQQRAALAFLTGQVFGPDAFQFPRSVMDKLAPERLDDFDGTIWQMQRLDYPIHAVVSSIQAWPLARLYNPLAMSRMVDVELWASEGQDVLTLAEMFAAVREAVWAEIASGSNINSFRRNLQRAHLARLTGLVIRPPAGAPEDAATLARYDLNRIKAGIEKALPGNLDETTRAHLDETLARIDAALKAGIQRQVDL